MINYEVPKFDQLYSPLTLVYKNLPVTDASLTRCTIARIIKVEISLSTVVEVEVGGRARDNDLALVRMPPATEAEPGPRSSNLSAPTTALTLLPHIWSAVWLLKCGIGHC